MRWSYAFHSFDSSAVLVKNGRHVNVLFGMLNKLAKCNFTGYELCWSVFEQFGYQSRF